MSRSRYTQWAKSQATRVGGLMAASLLLATCDLAKVGLGSKVDITPPALAITSPANGAFISEKSLTVRGTASDDLALDSVRVLVDGQSYPAAVKEGEWTVSIPVGTEAGAVAEGEKTLTVIAQDASGKEDRRSVRFTVDTKPPFVLVSVPQGYGSSAGTYSSYIDFGGEVWDPSPLDKVEVIVADKDGKEIKRKEAQGTTSWSVRFNIGQGEDLPWGKDESGTSYTFTVMARDRAGNTNNYVYHAQDVWALMGTYKIERFPVTSELGAMDQEERNAQLPDLQGLLFTDLKDKRLPCDEKKLGFTYDVDGTRPQITLTNLDASKPVTANVLGSKTPILGFVAPGPAGNAVDGASIRATVTPLGSQDATVKSLPVVVTSMGTVFNFTFALKAGDTFLGNGRYHLRMEASAKGGSPALPTELDFLIDNTIPQFVRLIPADEGYASRIDLAGGKGKGVRIELVVSDDNDTTDGIEGSKLVNVTARGAKDGAAIEGVSFTPGEVLSEAGSRIGRRWVVEVPYAFGTDLYFDYEARDASGATARRTHHVVIDEEAPTLTISEPPAAPLPVGAFLSGDSFIFRGTALDAQSGVTEVRYWLGARDGSDRPKKFEYWKSASGAASWSATEDLKALSEGAKLFSAWAKDAAGNLSEIATQAFTYDRTSPVASIAAGSTAKGYEESGVTYREESFTLSGECDDDAVTVGRRAVAAKLTVKKDGGGATELVFSEGGVSTGAWSYTQSVNRTTHADDGLYEYVLTVTDEAGRTSTATKTVRIDTSAPVIEVRAPAPNEPTDQANYTLRGSAYDTGSGLLVGSLVYVLNGGEEKPLSLIGQTWTADATLGSEGACQLVVKGRDLLGNAYTSDVVTFYYDKANPALTETAVGEDTKLTNGGFELHGSASDTNALSSLVVSVTKNDVAVKSWAPVALSGKSANWAHAVALTDLVGDGSYVFTVTVRDIAGRTSSLQRIVKVDTTKPEVTGMNLGNNELVRSASYTVLGSAADTGSGVARIEYSVDGTSWHGGTGGADWSVALSGLTDGLTKKFFVRAIDGAGNVGDAYERSYRVDLADPAVSVTGLTEGETGYRNSDVALEGSATDGNGIKALSVSYIKSGGGTGVLSTALPDGTGKWSATLPVSLGNGSYTLTVMATDKADQTSTVRRTVVIDVAPPVLEVKTPSGLVETQKVRLSGTVEDNLGGKGVSSLEYSLDSSDGENGSWVAVTLTGYTWVVEDVDTGAQEGEKSLWVRASDGLNAATKKKVTFTYDKADPVLSETGSGLTADQAIKKEAVSFGGSVSDTNGIKKLEVSVNGASPQAITTSVGAWNWTLPATQDGEYKLVFTAEDVAGRKATLSRWVLLDTEKPTTPVIKSSPGAFVQKDLVVNGETSDATSGVATVYYRIDDKDAGTLAGTSSWFGTIDLSVEKDGVKVYAEGMHTLKVWAEDRAGNLSEVATQAFIIDRADPSLSVDAAYDGIVFKNSPFSIDIAVSDTYALGAAPLTVTLSVNGSVKTLDPPVIQSGAGSAFQVWRQTVPIGFGDGLYVVTIDAKDSVDRPAQSIQRSITVDTTQPTALISALSPILAGNVVNGKITLNANVSDANGLWGVKYFVRPASGLPVYDDGDGQPLLAPYAATIDTSAMSGTMYLYIVARDKAGNESGHLATVEVNQASDVPVATIESPSPGDAIGADKRARGTFMDDDGVASGAAILYVKKSSDGNYTAFPIAASSAPTQLVSWSVDLSTFLSEKGDGIYSMYFRVMDDASKKSGLAERFIETAVQTFTWDNNPPTVSASIAKAPVKPAYKAGDEVTFSWTASDASGISSQTVEVDGAQSGLGAIASAALDFSVVYTVPANAISGNKIFTLVVTDATGRSTTRTASITVDTASPSVEPAFALDPGFVGFTPNGAFSIRGTASDNRALSKVQIKLTGSGGGQNLDWTDASLSNGSWSYAIADSTTYVPTSGNLGIELRAVDEAGNVSPIQSFSQFVDQAADKPTVTVISPVGGTTYGTTVQISGTAADDDGLADFDNNGVIDSDAIVIEYWNTASPGTTYTRYPVISGTGKSATWNYSLTSLSGGDYAVRVRAKDDAGKLGDWSAETTFTVDAGSPNLIVTSAIQAFINNGNLVISGTAEDSGGIKYVHARVNGGAWVLASALGMTDMDANGVWDSLATGVVNWSISLNLGTDGFKTIEIEAADNNDLVATAQRSTTLDTTAPSGSFDAQFRDHPSGSFLATTLLNKTVRITGTVTELNLRDTNPVEISIEDGVNNAWAPVTGTFVWSHVWETKDLPDGNYTIRLRITDKAGNVTDAIMKTVSTKQSADVPLITQAFVDAPNSASAGNNVLGAVLKISGTISDDDGFLSGAVGALLDGTTTVMPTNTSGTTGTWEYVWTSLPAGEHYISITATDRNGATRSIGPTYFIVDNANPLLSLSTPASGARLKAGSLVIAGTASDDGGFGATPLSLTFRHSDTSSSLHNKVYTPAVSGGVFTLSIDIDGAVKDGTLYMDLVLSDRAGRQSSVTRAVTIDTTAPSLSLNYPSHAAYINGLVSVTGTADDLNGLEDVSLQVLSPVTKLPIASLTRSSATLAAWEFPFNAETYASTTYAVDVNGDQKLWKVFFRLAATDRAGNVAEYKVGDPLDWPYFFIDTDGDKPTISVTQPKNGDKIGGFVNMFGTATDDDGPVMQVEARIDFNGDGDFLDSRDLDGDGTVQLGTSVDILGTTVKIGDAAHKWEDESAWYVIPVSNNAWTQELNSNGELYESNTGGTGTITIQVRSRDKFGLASEVSSRSIILDQTFPRIENAAPLDQSYQSGTFTLTAEFGDNIDLNLSSISQIKININKTGYQTLSAGPNTGAGHPYALTADLGNPQHGYDLAFPINTNTYFNNSSGILYVDLYVKDESGYVNQKTLTYYVDNQAPSSSWSTSTTRPDGANLRNGMISVNGVPKTYVEGNYGDSGSVSGISRIEAYFVKSGALRALKTSGTYGWALPTESAAIETYNLATNTWTPGTDPASPFATHAALGDNYVIKVDKASEMSDLGIGTDIDGDGYHEYLGIYEGAARWRAYFDSLYLPDGLADLHYVVYDLAGNRVHRVRQVFIANNGPVIDRLAVGSDLNNNGAVANQDGVEEIKDYYNPPLAIDRTDYQKIKNGKLYLGIEGSDPNGTNQGVKQIFVDVYDAMGTTRFGNAYTSALNPALGDAAVTLVPTPGTAPWTTGYVGGVVDYHLKVTVRDADDINVSRWIKVRVLNPADTTKPVVSLEPLSQADQDRSKGHLERKEDNTDAVWTSIKAAYGGDDDPKVSGALVIRGTVYDDNRITEVSVASENNPAPTLASWENGHLVSKVPSFTINTESLGENGHTVTFTYSWDSSKVTDVAGLNKSVSFSAKDGATTPNVADAKTQQVDVVPYITAIARSSSYNTSRSRLGAYVLRQGEEVTFTGFNLFKATTDTVSFTGSTLNLPSSATSTSFTVTLAQAAKSGPVYVTVNGYPSINNLNDNTKTWNSEVDPANSASARWNDDRAVHVWRSDNTQTGANRGYFTGSVDPVYPAMTIDANGTLYGSWSNYATANVYWGTNANGANVIYHSYDPLEHTDIHYGSRPNVVINANTYGNNTWDVTGAGGTYVWNAQATAGNEYSGTAYNGVYNAEALYHDKKLMQFINQRIVTSGDNIHISYYDTDTSALKYWYRQSGSNGAYSQTWINIDGGSDAHDGTRVVDAGGTSRSASAGEFSAIDLTPGTGYPVIAYYDAANQTVKLARASAVNPTAAQWALQTVMATNDLNYRYSGKYISMKIDSAGYVHLAFYRNSTGDLIYMKSTNNPTNGTTAYTFGPSVVIDSIGSVGVWADLSLDGNKPVISYLDSSMANTFDGLKLAYYDPALESIPGDTAGEPDTIDGWETMNAALGYEVENVRTSVEFDVGDKNFWYAAVGYSSSDYYRIGYYVK